MKILRGGRVGSKEKMELEGQGIVIKYFFFCLLRSFYSFGRKGSPALIVRQLTRE
jgi:hypothetical protein